ncbi:hypothetical protein D3C87_1495250 [compost metagenome]
MPDPLDRQVRQLAERAVRIGHRPVMGVDNLLTVRSQLTFDVDNFLALMRRFPLIIMPVEISVFIFKFDFIQIENIRIHIGNTPCDTLVETDDYTWNAGQRHTVHVDVG